jgi:hypothetical protein
MLVFSRFSIIVYKEIKMENPVANPKYDKPKNIKEEKPKFPILIQGQQLSNKRDYERDK